MEVTNTEAVEQSFLVQLIDCATGFLQGCLAIGAMEVIEIKSGLIQSDEGVPAGARDIIISQRPGREAGRFGGDAEVVH